MGSRRDGYMLQGLKKGQQHIFFHSPLFHFGIEDLIFAIPWGRHTKRVFLSACTSNQNVIIEEINFTAKDCGVTII